MRELTKEEYEAFYNALLSAYPMQPMLEMMLQFRLGKPAYKLMVTWNPYPYGVFQLMGLARAEGWLDKLLLRAIEANPGNSDLQAVAQMLSLSAATPQLEKMIRQDLGFVDVAPWRANLGRLETQICRIEVPVALGIEYGTGFLVAPDLVLTNYHVIAKVHGRQVPAQRVALRFDYKAAPGGPTGAAQQVQEGLICRLAEEWLVDSSPVSPVDAQPSPKAGTPTPEELDYALLRLADAPGSRPVGESHEPMAQPRGFIPLPTVAPILTADAPLMILQHPRSQPLKLAYESRSVLDVNPNRTRVTYRTNTDWGSSGSPCFDKDWSLVALHHSGVPEVRPNTARDQGANEGIPIDAIVQSIQAHGKENEVRAR